MKSTNRLFFNSTACSIKKICTQTAWFFLNLNWELQTTEIYYMLNSQSKGRQQQVGSKYKILVAFDFDHTIVQENSDLVACKLATSIPSEVKALYTSNGWTLYMREEFKLLHNENIKKQDIISAMHNMSAVTGMDQLLKWLDNKGCEIIIISDSNSVFIQEWLKLKQVDKYVIKVFTNPAFFNSDELLNIDMYHIQDSCNLSNENLCKEQILEDYINQRQSENVLFEKVAYVGDSSNDLCPSLRLNENDLVFPRIDFPLCKKLSDSNEYSVKAKVHPWRTGLDILSVIDSQLSV